MQVLIAPSAAAVGRFAAGRIADVVRRRPDAVLGLATGSSPLDIYAELARQVVAGELDLSAVRAFALDEYIGLPADHPQSYHAVIDREVVQPTGMDPKKVRVPNGFAEDLDAACEEFERELAAVGPVDVQILGVGTNGHIGFNEPMSSFGSRTRVKRLTPTTRQANARFFDSVDDVPELCLTQGIATVMEAKELLLVAQGTAKAEAVARMVEGPVSSSCPGSVLQFHPSATVIVDEPAAARLEFTDYYERLS
ncbi:MAG TPA: glucosamine-6-phosphate deaminase [Microlunatus sp.]